MVSCLTSWLGAPVRLASAWRWALNSPAWSVWCCETRSGRFSLALAWAFPQRWSPVILWPANSTVSPDTIHWLWSVQPWCLVFAPLRLVSFPHAALLPSNQCRLCAPNNPPSRREYNEHAPSKPSLRAAAVAQDAGIHSYSGADAGARYRREHRRLQRDERDPHAIAPCEPPPGAFLCAPDQWPAPAAGSRTIRRLGDLVFRTGLRSVAPARRHLRGVDRLCAPELHGQNCRAARRVAGRGQRRGGERQLLLWPGSASGAWTRLQPARRKESRAGCGAQLRLLDAELCARSVRGGANSLHQEHSHDGGGWCGARIQGHRSRDFHLSLIHISEPTR